MAKDDTPPSWEQALSDASASIASAMASPGADVKFGLALIGAISSHTQRKAPQAPQAGGAGAGAPGGPGAGGGQAGPPSAPPGMSPAGQSPAGGGQPNQAMKSQAAPGGPIPGGMSPGLGISGDAQNADELRRVLSDVAGS
jgi:hypothetical protein